MRKSVALALLLSGLAAAQSVTITVQFPKLTWPAGNAAPVRFQLPPARAALKNVFPAGYDAAEACANLRIDAQGDLDLTWPARFPNAERREIILTDYRLNCPTFTVERVRYKTLTVTGLSLPEFDVLLERDGRDQPYLLRGVETRLEMGEGDALHAVTYNDEAPRKDLVVVARQAGKDPVVVVFNGANQPAYFDRTQPMEVFWKADGGVPWGRMVYEHDRRIIHFDFEHPFPYK